MNFASKISALESASTSSFALRSGLILTSILGDFLHVQIECRLRQRLLLKVMYIYKYKSTFINVRQTYRLVFVSVVIETKQKNTIPYIATCEEVTFQLE